MIRFKAKPYAIKSWLIVRLPKDASIQLPSRGQVMVKGEINDFHFQTALEPDGDGSHWLNVDKAMQKAAGIRAGDSVTLAIESSKDWPEPVVPADVQAAVDADPQTHDLWGRITPLARWEWIRWIGATAQSGTRTHRIEVAISKMKHGERRPCCFNRSMCCVPQVSKSGVLLKPGEVDGV
ncbi:MAG TPA: YdeI/OmpD-associated family protein [Candidatus Saccharimonadales bacterium]